MLEIQQRPQAQEQKQALPGEVGVTRDLSG